jgi:hypothetical protein
VLGLLCLIANEALDRWPFKQKMTAEDKEDKNTLYELFSQMHLPTYDWFFHHGKSSMVYIPPCITTMALRVYSGNPVPPS